MSYAGVLATDDAVECLIVARRERGPPQAGVGDGGPPAGEGEAGGRRGHGGDAILGWLTRTAKKDGRVAVCGNAAGTKLETMVFRFTLRGVDLLRIESDWCDVGTRRELWKRMAKGGDLHPLHLDKMTRTIDFDELPDALGAFLDGGSKGRTWYASRIARTPWIVVVV